MAKLYKEMLLHLIFHLRNVLLHDKIIIRKVIYSVQHHTYIVINTELAICFSYNEPSSGQYLKYGRGAFRDCVQCGILHCLRQFLLKIQVLKSIE